MPPVAHVPVGMPHILACVAVRPVRRLRARVRHSARAALSGGGEGPGTPPRVPGVPGQGCHSARRAMRTRHASSAIGACLVSLL
eukprot:CAMPEP_0119355806 /NCGR_PEP_ID=MMETSP1334-20130426/4595_1 /TAXON_ID=127549 /ORGANISM="Calcidiscus leptoporus, Strain RCC1130" /LENGTH=83 /DNA_ID=CAMNT_0007369729 /DNA_START=65 /DNA_END=312 /DNA_ORIENTATION=+